MEIRIENLCFHYKNGAPVLRDISLTFDRPGLVCIIGPNGVGKSTLVRCINGISKPTSGDIYIDGRNTRDMKLKEIAEHIGYVPAGTEDCFSMPVIDTIMMGRYNHYKVRSSRRDIEVVHKVMDMLDIEDLAMRGFNQLSAGQHQKVAIARGLVTESEIMILDEPTSNLDVRHQIYVTELLRAIAEEQDKLIIMICHDLNVAAKYAHEVVVLEPPGIVYGQGTPKEIFTKEMLRHVYGVDCDILLDGEVPYIKLGFALPEVNGSYD